MRLARSTTLFSCLLSAVLLLDGCGFKVRGFDLGLPFQRIAIEGGSGVANEVRQMIYGQPSVAVVQKPTDAQVVLIVMGQNVDRIVLAFSSAGRPREIQLRMRVMYRITDGFSIELVPPQEITLTRDISVSEAETLALPTTEAFMQNDMQRDIGQQLIRRLRAVKLPTG